MKAIYVQVPVMIESTTGRVLKAAAIRKAVKTVRETPVVHRDFYNGKQTVLARADFSKAKAV